MKLADRKIFLVGMPGSGKSTVAKLLAQALKLPYIDLDKEIEEAEGVAIKMIFAQKGEPYFRQSEAKMLSKNTNKAANFVMATGGGTPCYFDNMETLIAAGMVVYLNASIETLLARTKGSTTRPLLGQNRRVVIESLIKNRKKYYKMAHISIETDGKQAAEIVNEILDLPAVKIYSPA